jgi:GNAT superfamily N-acetyltransferase
MPTIRRLHSDEDILLSWPVVFALRPHLHKEGFLEQVREQQLQGYEMIGLVVIEDGREVIASFSGFRPMYKLSGGRSIYIDDLSTLPEYRGKGYGGLLLDYIHALAREQGMTNVQLDSGHHRSAAHRLYLNKGYVISAHHFTRQLD